MPNLKSIDGLNQEEYEFIIPSYQRGYRWSDQQVTDLLEDILEFKSNVDKDNFYCVQPLIVQRKSSGQDQAWYVIDGQQRLTTIYIIMSYIMTMFPIYETKFEISYETRKASKDFLEDISDDEKREKMKDLNIDFYFMSQSYDTIKKWFGNDRNKAAKLAMDIMNKLLEQVKFIWYEIGDHEDPIETFTRINLGKIPLTNSELIKALLLQRDNFQEENKGEGYTRLKQMEIASEWNMIENHLQEDEFWYFINGTDEYETRIEFIFEALVDAVSEDEIEDREYRLFHFFNSSYNTQIKEGYSKVEVIEAIWKQFKVIYYTFDEWYRDRTLYHYIGFIVTDKIKTISQIVKRVGILSQDSGLKKDEILREIKKIIKESLKFDGELEDLTYAREGRIIRRLLLIFNVQTLENSNAPYRFPFHLYKKEQWDLEHIHAIKSDVPSRKNDQREYLETIKNNAFLSSREKGREIQAKAAAILESRIGDESFNKLYDEIITAYGVNNDNDYIANIALLDSQTNRSYKNSPFPIKREAIIKNDKQGKFIPVCTKNVFLKYYTTSLEQLDFWSEKDEKDYISAIRQTLELFIDEGDG